MRMAGSLHVGDWDFGVSKVPVFDKETKTQIFDALPGGAGFIPRMCQVMLNPLSEDYVEGTADIVTGFDGGLYAADDPRHLGDQ